MQVRALIPSSVEAVDEGATVEQAALLMRSEDIGALPVRRNGTVVGIVTDRDIVVRGVATGRMPSEMKVGDVMTKDVVSCYEDQDVEEAAALMKERQVRRIVVLTRGKQLTGIVTLGDLALLRGNVTMKTEVLERVSAPAGTAYG